MHENNLCAKNSWTTGTGGAKVYCNGEICVQSLCTIFEILINVLHILW